jgi:predicted nuclease of predicted toxin-antitoxin system
VKLLADQNIRVQTVEFLRQLGHDVVDTRELGLQKASDQDVALAAEREDKAER